MRGILTETLVLVLLSIWSTGCGGSDRPEPLDPQAASLLGQAQQSYSRADYAGALRLVDSAAAIAPEAPDPWYLRGVVLTDLYRFDESNEALIKAKSLDPEYRSVRFNMGHNAFVQSSVFAKNEYRKALRHYREEEQLLRRALSFDQDNRKQSELAQQDKDRAGLAAVLVQIGTTYARLNLPDSAAQAYKNAIRVDSTNARAHAFLAALLQAAGEHETALSHARKAATIDANNTEHRLLVGVLLNELGRYEESLPHLEASLHAMPWDPSAAYNLGQALTEVGRVDEGSMYLGRVDSLEDLRSQIQRSHMRLFKNPADPVRWENYAFLLHKAGRIGEARKAAHVYLTLSDTLTKQ